MVTSSACVVISHANFHSRQIHSTKWESHVINQIDVAHLCFVFITLLMENKRIKRSKIVIHWFALVSLVVEVVHKLNPLRRWAQQCHWFLISMTITFIYSACFAACVCVSSCCYPYSCLYEIETEFDFIVGRKHSISVRFYFFDYIAHIHTQKVNIIHE